MPVSPLDLSATYADWTIRASLSPTRRRLPRPPHSSGPGAYFAHIHPPLQPSPDIQPPRSDFPFFLRSPTLSARSIDSDPFAMDLTPDLSPRPTSMASDGQTSGGGSALASPVSPREPNGVGSKQLTGKFLYDLPDPNTFGEPRLSYSTSCNSTRTSEVIRDYGEDGQQDVTVRIRESSNGTIADQDEYAVQRSRSISDPKRRQQHQQQPPPRAPAMRLRKRMSRPMLTEEYVRRAMTPEPCGVTSVEGVPHQFDPAETQTGPMDYSHAIHDVRAQMDRLRTRGSSASIGSSSSTSSSRFEYDATRDEPEEAPLSRSGSRRIKAHDENFEFGYGGESSFASDVGSTRRLSPVGSAPARDVDATTVQRWGGVESFIERLESETRGQYDGGVIEDLIGSTHVRLASLGNPNMYALLDLLLPVISSTVVTVDISNNSLRSVPPGLRQCHAIEELRLNGNPLVSLPSWLGHFGSLRKLELDDCRLKALPADLMHAHNLKEILVRNNRLISLPSWLSQLPQLETLLVDGNPFAGPWVTLVAAITLNRNEAESIPPVPPIPAEYVRPSLSRGRSATGGPSTLQMSQGPVATPPPTALLSAPLESRKPHLEGRGHKSKTIRRMRSAGALLGIQAPSPPPVERHQAEMAMPSPPPPPQPASEKPRKWGFLKKMSMNKLRGGHSHSTSPQPPMPVVTAAPQPVRPTLSTTTQASPRVPLVDAATASPTIDLSLDIDIPSTTSPLLPPSRHPAPPPPPDLPLRSVSAPVVPQATTHTRTRSYELGLKSIMSYLRDLYDLSLPMPNSTRGAEIVHSESIGGTSLSSSSFDLRAGSPTPYAAASPHVLGGGSRHNRSRRPTIDSGIRSDIQTPTQTPGSSAPNSRPASIRKMSRGGGDNNNSKDDPQTRASVIKHIIETEQTYVRGLRDLVEIYVAPAAAPTNSGASASAKGGDSVVPATERRIVFGGIEGIMRFHSDSFLPALQEAAAEVLAHGVRDEDVDGERSRRAARAVGEVFRTYQPYMRQYSAYINNFDFALARLASWMLPAGGTGAGAGAGAGGNAQGGASPGVNGSLHAVTSIAGVAGGAAAALHANQTAAGLPGHSPLTAGQRKRVKHYLQACRSHPKHTQINLESYLLLPVQRIPRYKMLLSDLTRATPDEPILDSALNEMISLASIMNEEKREAESRQRLVTWQSRIRGRFPTPLVQAHRRLLLDGPLVLTRVVKRASLYVEVSQSHLSDDPASSTLSTPVTPPETTNGQGSSEGGPRTIVQIDTLHSETPGKLMSACLTSDLMVLCTAAASSAATTLVSTSPHPQSPSQSPLIATASSPSPWGHHSANPNPPSPSISTAAAATATSSSSVTSTPASIATSTFSSSSAMSSAASASAAQSPTPTPPPPGTPGTTGTMTTLLDLYAVLRLQTKPRPATLVRRPGGGGGGTVIRLVDNKTILYLQVPPSLEGGGGVGGEDDEEEREQVAERWCRTLNEEFEAAR